MEEKQPDSVDWKRC